MNKNKLIAYTAAALVLLAAATKIIERHRANRELEFENSGLRSKAALIDLLQEENARLRSSKPEIVAAESLVKERQERRRDRAELERLRERLAHLERQETEHIESVRGEIMEDQAKIARGKQLGEPNAFGTVPVTGNIPISAARNQGIATPEALLETWLWAVEHGQAKLLRELRFTPGIPDEAKDQLRPEAVLMMDETALSDVVELVLKEKLARGDDEVRYAVELKRDREPVSREWVAMYIHLKRFGKDWKIFSMGGRGRDSE